MIAIGAGRIGAALERAARRAGHPFTLIDRTSGWEALDGPAGEPVLALVRVDDLPAVADRVPRGRLADLVLVQNGMLREWLRAQGLDRCTRAELYFAVASREAEPVVGLPSLFCGPHAAAVAGELTALGIDAREVGWPIFTYYELEKTVWLVVFGLLCEKYGVPVGEIARRHAGEVSDLARELMSLGRRVYGVDAPHAFTLDRLLRYAASIAGWPASLREPPHRVGWFVTQARIAGVRLPAFEALLAARGASA